MEEEDDGNTIPKPEQGTLGLQDEKKKSKIDISRSYANVTSLTRYRKSVIFEGDEPSNFQLAIALRSISSLDFFAIDGKDQRKED